MPYGPFLSTNAAPQYGHLFKSVFLLISSLLSLIPLIFACVFYRFYLGEKELQKIINTMKPNLSIEQLKIIESKNESISTA